MPEGFNIGPLTIRFYGIILMAGALAGAWLASREARRRQMNSEFVWDALIWVLIGGIIGARLWHILTPPPSMVARGITTWYYLTHPLDAINIRAGGLGIPGAVIGGVAALYFYCRRKKMSIAPLLDIAAPGLALGQAIGRWGNFVNQELYGAPTDLPWAIYIDPAHRLPEFQDIAYYHPLFLYESLWNLANMFLLLWVGRRFADRLKTGDLFLVYLIVYPVGRFLLEFLRLDASQVANLNANQTLMAVIAVLSAGFLIWRHRRSRETQVQETT
ncbi:MAG: prolipoprotein diacylglyceryl transferase [Chloroflexi bacterium]|jgi:phosphatidylglycerol:prolipoprotein diacylglycerol transferase|nr:prolipoprotein diacylglyceryl transferase [Chloroflexota bacterium]